MAFSSFLEVGIVLLFVYLLGSIIVSNCNEILGSLANKRGKILLRAVEAVLDDGILNKNFAHLVYTHPRLERMQEKRGKSPSYLAPRLFAQTLVDVISEEAVIKKASQDPNSLKISILEESHQDAWKDFQAGVEQLNYSDLKVWLRSFTRQTNSYDSLVDELEKWYEDYMDRVTGWYKKRIRWQLLFISTAVAVLLNIDTIQIVRTLWVQSALRTQISDTVENVITQSEQNYNSNKPYTTSQRLDTLKATYEQLSILQLPIGWSAIAQADQSNDSTQIQGYSLCQKIATIIANEIQSVGLIYKIIGWSFSIIAFTFGAPFWFDVLRYLVNIRQSGIKPQPRPKPPVS